MWGRHVYDTVRRGCVVTPDDGYEPRLCVCDHSAAAHLPAGCCGGVWLYDAEVHRADLTRCGCLTFHEPDGSTAAVSECEGDSL